MLTVDNDQPAWYAYLNHVAGVVPDKNGAQAGISALCHDSVPMILRAYAIASVSNG